MRREVEMRETAAILVIDDDPDIREIASSTALGITK